MNINDILSSVLFATSFLVLYIAYFSKKNGKSYITYCLMTVAIYGMGYGFEILRPELSWIKFWLRVEYIGIVFLPIAWLYFVFHYIGKIDKFTKRCRFLLTMLSISILAIVYTNPWHHLYYKRLYIDKSGPFPIAGIERGPLFWLDTAYAYIATLVGIFILIQFYKTSISIIRRQVAFLIFAWLIPWIADVVYSLNIIPFRLDLCPFAFCISGIISSLSIFNYSFIKLTPIAIETVFQKMSDGVLILDNQENIVNYNMAASEILKNATKSKSNSIQGWIDFNQIRQLLDFDDKDKSLIRVVNAQNKVQVYKVTMSEIHQSNAQQMGKIIVFSDVTQIELARKSQTENYLFLQTLLDAMPNPMYAKDRNGIYTQSNQAFCDFFGVEKSAVIGKSVFELFDSKRAQKIYQMDQELLTLQQNQNFESKLPFRDGTDHDIFVFKSVIPSDELHQIQGIAGIFIDITERKRNEEKILRLTKVKESMFKIGYMMNELIEMKDLLYVILTEVMECVDENSSGSILVIDDYDMLKIAVSKGYDSKEAKNFEVSLEHHLKWINHGESIEKTIICNNIDLNPYIHILKTSEGKQIKSTISSPIIIEGKLYGFLNINSVNDMTYGDFEIEMMEYMRDQVASVILKHRLYETTLYLSRYDHLTNIFNRSYFEKLFHEITSKALTKRSFFLVLFDLNDLKHINDAYGHLAGDATILKFADGLRFELSSNDFIGRYGGDEFVGVFFDTSIEELDEKFSFLLLEFSKKPVRIEKERIKCSFSYGIACYPNEGEDFHTLVKKADERMYENKKKKKALDAYT